MNSHFPGDIFLHAHTLLDYPHMTASSNHNVTFDVIIRSSVKRGEEEPARIVCSLQYTFQEEEIVLGTYDMEAKVTPPLS